MYLKIIVRDDVKRICGKTTDSFLDAVDSIFYSPVYEIENEAEIEIIKNAYVANCTKVRKPIVQVVIDETSVEL